MHSLPLPFTYFKTLMSSLAIVLLYNSTNKERTLLVVVDVSLKAFCTSEGEKNRPCVQKKEEIRK
jgi:hypothetical protein